MGLLQPAFFILIRRWIAISQELMINDEIRDKEVRVISKEGEQLGVMPIAQAKALAESQQLDLVMIAPQGKPPVCKIMDYGKYHFEATKREKELRKNQRIVNIKEVRLSATIEPHDVEVRVKSAIKFLKDGDKVKANIRFRGRQMAHSVLGIEIMNDFAARVAEFGKVEKPPRLEGRNMIMILAPKEVKETRE